MAEEAQTKELEPKSEDANEWLTLPMLLVSEAQWAMDFAELGNGTKGQKELETPSDQEGEFEFHSVLTLTRWIIQENYSGVSYTTEC